MRRTLARLIVPWLAVGAFVVLYLRFAWPALWSGHALGVVVGMFVSLALISFALAAVAMSWDVLRGR